MKEIPKHRLADKLDGEIAMLKRISIDKHSHEMNYAHRDDYFMFIFVEKGEAKVLIDFEEYSIYENSVYYILPEQVHLLTHHSDDASAWMLIIDSSLVKEEYKEVFERKSPFESQIVLKEEIVNELKQIIYIFNRRLSIDKQPISQLILYNMLSAYIGIIAEVHKDYSPTQLNRRIEIITSKFKSLLSDNYRTMKRPSEYADALNISPTYLNEVVKNTTGITVSESIRNEIIIRAKRLLFYTTMNIKDIAFELGYEDWAYFSRIFSKSTNMSPTEFRDKYRK